MFSPLDVRDGPGAVVVDLVADPTPQAEPPRLTPLGDTAILVDTPHQLLVNKLCALLSRSELRDLVDVRELLAHGEDLRRGLEQCPLQDAGFSPLTFGWSMRGLRVDRLGASHVRATCAGTSPSDLVATAVATVVVVAGWDDASTILVELDGQRIDVTMHHTAGRWYADVLARNENH